jgi:hypothetical protein
MVLTVYFDSVKRHPLFYRRSSMWMSTFREYSEYYESKGWGLRYRPHGGAAKYVIERWENDSERMPSDSLDGLWGEWSELVAACAAYEVKLDVLKEWAFSEVLERKSAFQSFIQGEEPEEELLSAMEDAHCNEVLDRDFDHHEYRAKEISFRYFDAGCYDDRNVNRLLRDDIKSHIASEERSWLNKQLPPSASIDVEQRTRL